MKLVDPIRIAKGILVFTDGACSGNPGPGGWGAVVVLPQGEVVELGGRKEPTTNNEMEMAAILEALRFVKSKGFTEEVHLFSDSTYALRGIQSWIWGWRKNTWKNSEGQEVANRELWESLFKVVYGSPKLNIEWYYSRGHQGTPGNERCDQIAVAFSQKKYIQLYRGPLVGYPIPIHDLPEDGEMPEMRPQEPKKKAYSYLSMVGGIVYRHFDWASCERRVKGQSGAKFKKAESPEDEKNILSSWGVSDPSVVKE